MRKCLVLLCLITGNSLAAANISLLDSIQGKCSNNTLMVHFTKNGTYNSGNIFRVQLSDSAGSFSSPTTIGTKPATGSGSDSILCSFPQGIYGTRFTLRIIATNTADTSKKSNRFTIAYMPKVQFGVNDSLQCFRHHEFAFVNQTDSSTVPVLQFWLFSDGGFSISTQPRYTFRQAGTYRITLYTFTFGNCFDSAVRHATVYPMPALGFSTNKDSQCIKYHKFTYRDTSNKQLVKYSRLWDLGDNTTATDTLINKTYAAPGLYTVSLIVNTVDGCRDTFARKRRVFPMPKPGFTLNSTIQCQKQSIFSFTDTTNTSVVAYSRNWLFGDATGSVLVNPSKHYNNPGTLNPRLIITTSDGCQDTAVIQVTVNPSPSADFVTDSSRSCESSNRTVYTNNSSISSGSFTQMWKFSDGTTDTALGTTKFFNGTGVYDAMLITRSNLGCLDTAFGKTVIWPTPVASFVVNSVEQCFLNNRFVFNSQSTLSSGFMNFSWSFGDGGTSGPGPSPAHFYPRADSFNVRLIATTVKKSCRDTAIKMVRVRPQPLARFNVNETIQCFDSNEFTLTNTSLLSYGSYTSKWKLGNDDSVFATHTQYVYSATGNYIISLELRTNYGCLDTAYAGVTVLPNPEIEIIPLTDTIVCQGDSVKLKAIGGDTYRWSNNDTTDIITVASSAKLSVRGTSIYLCSSNATPVHAIINPLPAKPSIVKTGKDSLRSSYSSGNQWHKGNFALTGDTGQYYHYTSKASYFVVYTDKNGCSNRSDSIVITSLSDINSIAAPQPRIYPNPTNNIINILFHAPYTGTVQLTDVLGKVVFEMQITDQFEIHVPLEGLQAGVYYLRAGNGAWKVEKI